jgi:hypothetical protein
MIQCEYFFFFQQVQNLWIVDKGPKCADRIFVFAGGIQNHFNGSAHSHAETGFLCNYYFHLHHGASATRMTLRPLQNAPFKTIKPCKTV